MTYMHAHAFARVRARAHARARELDIRSFILWMKNLIIVYDVLSKHDVFFTVCMSTHARARARACARAFVRYSSL